jgi:hypothetical protein
MASYKGILSVSGVREAQNAIEPMLLVLADRRF